MFSVPEAWWPALVEDCCTLAAFCLWSATWKANRCDHSADLPYSDKEDI